MNETTSRITGIFAMSQIFAAESPTPTTLPSSLARGPLTATATVTSTSSTSSTSVMPICCGLELPDRPPLLDLVDRVGGAGERADVARGGVDRQQRGR